MLVIVKVVPTLAICLLTKRNPLVPKSRSMTSSQQKKEILFQIFSRNNTLFPNIIAWLSQYTTQISKSSWKKYHQLCNFKNIVRSLYLKTTVSNIAQRWHSFVFAQMQNSLTFAHSRHIPLLQLDNTVHKFSWHDVMAYVFKPRLSTF